MKAVFVTGGVVSSLGKGIAAACIGTLLKAHGYKVSNIKIDPYLNVDPGTMSPICHGEVFVTDDGAETDLDLGHYERFVDVNCSKLNSFSSGQVYLSVIEKERKGEYLGETIQVVPHITNEIKDRIKAVGNTGVDFVIAEIGGTVGDIESMPFLEAIRQMAFDIGRENVLYIHMALAPYLKASGEIKTKPVQQSVKEIGQLGIQPDIILCRSEHPLDTQAINKISLFCNVDKDYVFQAIDVNNIYKLPLVFQRQYLDLAILNKFKMRPNRQNEDLLSHWKELEHKIDFCEGETCSKARVLVVGKYTGLNDSYKSIYESLKHAAYSNSVSLEIYPFDAEKFEQLSEEELKNLTSNISGILVPGGFGNRGIEGKIKAARYARENNIPYLGICLGMQIAVIEFARNVLGLKDANSTEFDQKTKNPIIDLMQEQKEKVNLGGTMRLGSYNCDLNRNTNAIKAYREDRIAERHRHRYELNNHYLSVLEDNGLIISGKNLDTNLAEIIEIKDHRWFVGCQFHPEFKSRPLQPHPLFVNFIKSMEG